MGNVCFASNGQIFLSPDLEYALNYDLCIEIDKTYGYNLKLHEDL